MTLLQLHEVKMINYVYEYNNILGRQNMFLLIFKFTFKTKTKNEDL
jgi:hypothetical protein